MPKEESLNEPLSGAEIKAIILDEIERKLNLDSTLGNDLSYPGFQVSFTANIKYLRTLGTAGTMVWGIEKHGEVPTDAPTTVIGVEYTTPDSPNAAREDHGLPTPALTQTPAGTSEKIMIPPRRPGRPPRVRQ